VTEEQFGRNHRQFVNILDNLGYLNMTTGRYEEAEVQFRQSLAITEGSALGLDDVVIRSLHGLGKTYMKRNEDAQAEAALSRALGLARGNGINRPEAAGVQNARGYSPENPVHLQAKERFTVNIYLYAVLRQLKKMLTFSEADLAGAICQ